MVLNFDFKRHNWGWFIMISDVLFTATDMQVTQEHKLVFQKFILNAQ